VICQWHLVHPMAHPHDGVVQLHGTRASRNSVPFPVPDPNPVGFIHLEELSFVVHDNFV
jgi:hypothetical protein